MIILVLIFWSVVGLFMMAQLYDEGYLEDISRKVAWTVGLICGPIAWIALIYGLILKFVKFIIDKQEDEE